ncbi:MAG TPA: cupin domain-containing protein [Fibrobacteria bacterium]|nr:cupin domain-containing protein [Fibrobacteria bacterium]
MQMEARPTQKVRNVPMPRLRIHLDFAGIWNQGVWLTPRPGIKVRELFQSDDGYRISMVRYAPGAKVPDHLHTGDEHSYVLEGSVRDGSGEYAAGSYLLNPMGSRHGVWSDRGALVLTHRLGPIRFLSGWRPDPEALPGGRGFPGDRMPVFADTGAESGAGWEPLRPGLEVMSLFEGAPGNYKTALMRYRPGSSMPAHIHLGDEHVYILSGCQEDEYGSYDTGAYVYNPMGTAHRVWSEEGCLALIHWRAPVRYL